MAINNYCPEKGCDRVNLKLLAHNLTSLCSPSILLYLMRSLRQL
ncbi:hypothetical protein [Nostoc sp. DedQUE04]|nr:hypothetical protein [Nostoc sp. DedQUE04]